MSALRPFTIFTALMIFTLALGACATVPITGREQLRLVPEGTLVGTSRQQYQEILAEEKVVTGTQQSQMVQQVGTRIASAVEQFLAQQGQSQTFEWEFNLLDNPEVNAWAMPGGKVAVNTGLLKVADTPARLATVMGHEVAHVVAGHGSERLSQGLLTQMGGMALAAALSSRPQQTRELWMTAFGVGAQVGVMLPYSRLQEREADRLGLIFMAIAGYDPQAALELWQRMHEQSGAPQTPGFLRTHPTDQQRIQDIRSYLPEALQYYRGQ